ncbi:hypothetical protein [Actinomadura madurae]|uniref:hypothetical protein n=1 Tax=Actinomadura madurae TaxID=1993 RepID=UPI0027E31F5A|nr:hypothetical protein [Actinomadura madurae]
MSAHGIVELAGVTKEYAGGVAALRGVDLVIAPGSWPRSSGRPGPASRRCCT